MDSQEINASRRRFLTAMLAVGAASALAPSPLIKKRGLPVKIQNSGFSPVRIMALLKQK